jgi:hypothetical protein
MDHLASCYFCGTAMDDPLQDYRVVPAKLDGDAATTVTLCPSCQGKLERLLAPVAEATGGVTLAVSPGGHGGTAQRGHASADPPVAPPDAGTGDSTAEGSTAEDSTAEGTGSDDVAAGPEAARTDPEGATERADAEAGSGTAVDDGPDLVEVDGFEDPLEPPVARDSGGEADGGDDTPAVEGATDTPGLAPADPAEDSTDGDGDTGPATGGSDTGEASPDDESDDGRPDSESGDGRPDSDGAEATGDGPADPETTDGPAGGADAAGGESATDGEGDSGQGREASAEADGSDATARTSVTALEYNKVMRLLQNREFPVDREEIEVVAASAYELAQHECGEVIDLAIDRGLVAERDGKLVRPE